jgi:hypothetical protein
VGGEKKNPESREAEKKHVLETERERREEGLPERDRGRKEQREKEIRDIRADHF